MFTLAVRAGKLAHRPHVPLLSEAGNARTGFLEPADFAALRAELPPWLADAATFAYLTGWRRGEVSSLEWCDVSLGAREIRLRAEHSKTKRPRVVKLTGELLGLVERRHQGRRLDVPLVFHRGDGTPLGDFRKAWMAAATMTGHPGLLFHDLRRSAVRNMVRAGVPERVAMAVSGHRTRSIFDRYDITSDADLAAAAERTAAYVAAEQTAPPRVTPLGSTRGRRPGGEPAQNAHSRDQAGAAPGSDAAATA
jgi:integrase